MLCALGVHYPTAPVIFQHGAMYVHVIKFLKFHPRSAVASRILNWKQYTSDLSPLFDYWNCQLKQAISKLRSLIFWATPKICIAGSWPTKKLLLWKPWFHFVFWKYSCYTFLAYWLTVSVFWSPSLAFCSRLSQSSSSLQCQFLLPLHVLSSVQSHSPN